MAKSIRLLQIGDIHLPEWENGNTRIDDKDTDFSEEIKADIVTFPLHSILKRISEIATSGTIDAAVCVGDFTTRGETQFIEPAVEIINFLLTDSFIEHAPLIFGVPGNHDVSRTDAMKLGAIEKFAILEAAFEKFGWPPPPVDDCVRYEIRSQGGQMVPIHLLNSSIGSWSPHLLPSSISAELSDKNIGGKPFSLTKDSSVSELAIGLEADVGFSDRLDQAYNQLDTPYFPARALQTLRGYADDVISDAILVVAHHNLLPQTIPRITHYSELLNGGQVRKLFQNINKTVIYLHGHIHDDPVERISTVRPQNLDGCETEIICISAPPIWEGFNEICLFLDEEDEIFLVRVTEYRPDELGNVANFSDQVSKYIPVKGRVEHLVTPSVQRVWSSIRDKKTLSWREITKIGEKQNLNEQQIEHALLSLFCCSLVHIGGLGRDVVRWRISIREAAA